MKSPFAIFRKHQKVAMAVLGILVMFAFVIGDALTSLSGTPLPAPFRVIMLAVIGAGLLGGIGYARGKAKDYAITGALLGALMGVLLPRLFTPTPAVETAAGNLSAEKLRQLVDRKRIANQFLFSAYEASETAFERELFQNPQFQRFAEMQKQRRISPFYFQDATEDNALQTYLMSHEADRMGITVSNDTINDYIRELTSRAVPSDQTQTTSLTKSQFREILQIMGISEKALFDALREEIKAKMALELIVPRNLATPHQYWREYLKLNVKQELEAAALPVEAFTKNVPDPSSEAELAAFFSQFRNVFPNQTGPGEPGFRQPQRLRLEFLEADYQTAEEEIRKKNEQDLLTQSERIAELQLIDNAIEDVKQRIQDGTIEQENAAEELEKVERKHLRKLLEGDKEITRLDFEVVKFYEDNRETLYKNRLLPDDRLGEQPYFPDSDTPEDSAGESEESKPESDTPAASSKETEQKQPKSGKQPPPDKSESEAPKDKQEDGSALLNSTGDRFFVSTSDEDDPDQPAGEESKQAEETSKEPDEKNEKQETPTAEEQTEPIRGPAPPPLPEDPPPPRYRPLTEDLKYEIRDELVSQKTRNLLAERMQKAIQAMQDIEDDFRASLDRIRVVSRDDDERPLSESEADELRNKISARLKQYAGENNLVYGATDLHSYMEFSEPENQEKYPIVSAGLPGSNQFNRQTILDQLFPRFSRSEEIYTARQAVATGGNRFAYWKIKDVDEYTPESLDEPGIREQVLHARKMREARQVVEKRAEELAEKVRKSTGPMSEALNGETLTGKEDDIEITVQPTESFSWLDSGLQDPSNPLGQPSFDLWDILTIENEGPKFMQTVFNELNDGEVGVAPNNDLSIYYVVKVKNRSTSDPGSLAALRQGFQNQNFQSGYYNNPYGEGEQKTGSNWRRRFFEEKYQVRRNFSDSTR